MITVKNIHCYCSVGFGRNSARDLWRCKPSICDMLPWSCEKDQSLPSALACRSQYAISSALNRHPKSWPILTQGFKGLNLSVVWRLWQWHCQYNQHNAEYTGLQGNKHIQTPSTSDWPQWIQRLLTLGAHKRRPVTAPGAHSQVSSPDGKLHGNGLCDSD